jgi:hypothetical protein
MFRVLAPQGRLALNAYSGIEHTPVALALAEALDRHLGPGASSVKRSEHVLADPDELRRLVVDAGFDDVVLLSVTQTIMFRSPRDYVRLQVAATPWRRSRGWRTKSATPRSMRSRHRWFPHSRTPRAATSSHRLNKPSSYRHEGANRGLRPLQGTSGVGTPWLAT